MLEKFLKQDRNEELERILEEKHIEEQSKNLLQGILYKVEVSYKDYKKAKVTDMTQKEYIDEILKNIENKCNQIKTIKLSQKLADQEIQKELEKHKFYIDQNEIITYPIEEKILYAIEKKSNVKKIVNNRYGILTQALTDLINTGKNIDRTEVLRDFNGWSWTTIKTEIESIPSNFIYQTLRLLIDEDFLNNWCRDTDGIIDYVEILKQELKSRYGEILCEQLVELIYKIAIINEATRNEKYKEEIIQKIDEQNKILEEFNNIEQYVLEKSNQKKDSAKEIKKIDQILSQDIKLVEEYKKRNANVPIEKKIFSIKVFKQQLLDRKEQLKNTIEECNYCLNPNNYIKEKNNIIEKIELYEIINSSKEQIEEVYIQYINLFLDCFEILIKKEESSEEISKYIFKFRYFLLLPFNTEKNIKDLTEIDIKKSKLEKVILKKSVEKKVLTKVPIEILKYVFETRIIGLEELYYKITKQDNKYYAQIFDENISEEKFEIQFTDNMKINKKIKIFN